MILGIDLGTINSLAAVWRGGEARLIPNALGRVLTPSAVSLSDSGDILVGLPGPCACRGPAHAGADATYALAGRFRSEITHGESDERPSQRSRRHQP